MKLYINGGYVKDFVEYATGKTIDGRFYESLREFRKYGGGDPDTFEQRWDDAEVAINIIGDKHEQ